MINLNYYSKEHKGRILLTIKQAADELIKYMKHDRMRYGKLIPIQTVKDIKMFDYSKIVNSSYEDYKAFLDDRFKVYSLMKTLSIINSMGNLNENGLSIKEQNDIKIPEEFKDAEDMLTFCLLLTSIISAFDNYYSIFNAVTFLIPYKRFDYKRIKWGEIESYLKKINSMGIDTVFFNVERKDGYPDVSWKLTKTDFTQTEVIFKDLGSEPDNKDLTVLMGEAFGAETNTDNNIEKGEKTPIWRLTRIEKNHRAKEVQLFRFIEDKNKKRDDFTRVGFEYGDYSLHMLNQEFNAEEIEKILSPDNRRFVTNDQLNTVDIVFRTPLGFIFTTDEKDDISFCFQALDAFINRKKIYKDINHSVSKCSFEDIDNIDDVAIIDINENEEDALMKIKDIVVYENENGVKYKTHHKSPRRHYVREYTKTNGTQVSGYWRGKDGAVYEV